MALKKLAPEVGLGGVNHDSVRGESQICWGFERQFGGTGNNFGQLRTTFTDSFTDSGRRLIAGD